MSQEFSLFFSRYRICVKHSCDIAESRLEVLLQMRDFNACHMVCARSLRLIIVNEMRPMCGQTVRLNSGLGYPTVVVSCL